MEIDHDRSGHHHENTLTITFMEGSSDLSLSFTNSEAKELKDFMNEVLDHNYLMERVVKPEIERITNSQSIFISYPVVPIKVHKCRKKKCVRYCVYCGAEMEFGINGWKKKQKEE